MSEPNKPSWRDLKHIHEAAAFFHKFSEEDPGRKQLKELVADINEKRIILDPIHTATVPLKAGEFVIDGISRLDALEAAGIQVVDEKGEWMGILSSAGGQQMRIHHGGKTDEEVWGDRAQPEQDTQALNERAACAIHRYGSQSRSKKDFATRCEIIQSSTR
jgi:hypothetical protein